MAQLGILGERLRSLVDSLDRSAGCIGVVRGDVLEDVFEPTQRFLGPD